jgi:hypothetical protein
MMEQATKPNEDSRIYKMKGLPWIDIEITTVDNGVQSGAVQYSSRYGKELYVQSRIHINKRVRVGPTYGDSWSDQSIIADLTGTILARFNNGKQPLTIS